MDGPIDVRSSQAATAENAAPRPPYEESRARRWCVAFFCISYGVTFLVAAYYMAFLNWMLVLILIPPVSMLAAGILALRNDRRWTSPALGGSLYILSLVAIGTRGDVVGWYRTTCAGAGLASLIFPSILAFVSLDTLVRRRFPVMPRAPSLRFPGSPRARVAALGLLVAAFVVTRLMTPPPGGPLIAAPGTADFVGTWTSVNSNSWGHGTAELKADGFYTANCVFLASKLCDDKGRWFLRDGAIVWVKEDRWSRFQSEDINPILEFRKTRFRIKEMDGSVSTFTKAP